MEQEASMDPKEEKQSECWAWISEAFKRTPEAGSPQFFTEQVMQRIRPQPARSPARRAWWWVPALAPALAMGWVLLVWAGQAPALSTEALINAGITANGQPMDLFAEEG